MHLDKEELENMPQGTDVFSLSDQVPTEEELYDLAELFKVFGDSTRIKILYVLVESDMSVGDIAQALNMTQSSISHQLRVLKQSRLVRFRREGKNIVYSLADDHVHTIMSQGLEHLEEVTKSKTPLKAAFYYIWYGKTVCNLLLFLVYRLHAYLSIVLHHFLSPKSQKTVYLSKEAAFHFENVKKCKCSRARKEKNTEIAMNFGVFF